jgi:hypothetical protein
MTCGLASLATWLRRDWQDFRRELWTQIGAATMRRDPHLEINSSEIYPAAGGYPGIEHRMPTCCDVMPEMHTGDSLLEGDLSGTRLVQNYMPYRPP